MPGPRCSARQRCGRWLAATVLIAALTACWDDRDAAVDPDESVAPTTDLVFEPTPTTLLPSVDPDFIDTVLADGDVSADELDAAFVGFIGCLTDAGGSGVYAYDLGLQTGLSVDWSLDQSTAGVSQEVVEASCSRDYLGDLVDRHHRANPTDGDLAQRRRDSIVGCVEVIDPAIAASIPDVVSVDTSGVAPAVFDLQLDPVAIGAGPEVATNVGRCLGSLGAPWQEFG